MPRPIHNWSLSTSTLDIATLLVEARPTQALSANEIAAQLTMSGSRAIRDRLTGLHQGGLVDRLKLQTGHPGPPAWGYLLSDTQRRDASDALLAHGSLSESVSTEGRLVRGMELVFVRLTGPAVPDMFEVASSSAVIQSVSWTAMIGNEMVFAFEGENPTPAAIDLMAVLAGARLGARRGAVSHVARVDEFLAQAERTAPAARRARMTRDAYAKEQ